ncbi:SGNH/GDSL hydrolase family protein [Algoriphagus pacificus]|uniref:SGNH/GDSL hydrolase family protein n=1 Tax=Algoriphagus pacificus TaxID=2811234 RepID=A0ABS3CI34_9BACT|nr:SGNH/GDSL hydrolase family protein [Algoriphagus pacificus]MBN7815821.1 SGNH/GDSL hydrolase family protein [Algoriphagus pacificus]
MKNQHSYSRLLLSLLFLFGLLSFAQAQESSSLKWWNPSESAFPVISGQSWADEVPSLYHRLPARAESNVRTAVWNLSKQSAGLSIRFWSNSDTIQVRYKVKGNISMPHMPATGVSGLDLYSKSYDGEWARSWGRYSIKEESSYTFVINDDSPKYEKYGREYQLFLPLYNEVENLEIGVEKSAFFEVLPVRREKPIVAYGTSICQGACASRPGMAWSNILERKLERPVMNFGFSGNGRMEPEVIALLTEIDAKAYILDCLPNLSPDSHDVYQLTLDAVHQLKSKRPNVPIILTEHVGYADSFTNIKNADHVKRLNEQYKKAFLKLKEEGVTGIYLLENESMGLGFESFVDIIHPNDYGMIQYAEAYEKLILEVLNEEKGQIFTTISTSQSRDIAVYKWEERHQEILKMNQENPPKILLFGNSIVNFWGGEPKIKTVNGPDSWENMLKPAGVRNFGYGWDRIENVLWRIYHDELDGFEADQILLMIGTNNLQINSQQEIVLGLENLIQEIKERQPSSEIVMVGLLPRRGMEKEVEQINLKISQMADLANAIYLEVGKGLLLPDGKLNESLFSDGLHPNESGYQVIAKELVPKLHK